MTSISGTSTEKKEKGSLWQAALMAIILSVIVNILARTILVAFWEPPADFSPMTVGRIAFLTTLFVFLGVVAFAIVNRLSNNPVRTYYVVALIGFIILTVPNIIFSADPDSAVVPNGTSEAFLLLIIFHVIAGVITVVTLTRYASDKPAG